MPFSFLQAFNLQALPRNKRKKKNSNLLFHIFCSFFADIYMDLQRVELCSCKI